MVSKNILGLGGQSLDYGRTWRNEEMPIIYKTCTNKSYFHILVVFVGQCRAYTVMCVIQQTEGEG